MALAAELGAVLENPVRQRASEADDPDRFGVYSTICRIVRSTGHAGALFTLLGLVQRDPALSLGEAQRCYDAYKVPVQALTPAERTTLVPTLYLYRFEPVAGTREVMAQLWEALVPPAEAKGVVDSLEHEIIAVLLTSLASPSWRRREAACRALEKLLPSRRWAVVHAHLEGLWEAGMRVRDDVRESTRLAGAAYTKVLADLLLKAADAAQSSAETVQQCVAYIVPYLLDKGLLLPSQEAIAFALGTLTYAHT